MKFFITFSTLQSQSPLYCSVSKEKHDQVYSAALLNWRKIQILLQLPDPDSTRRVASMAHWTLFQMSLMHIFYSMITIFDSFWFCQETGKEISKKISRMF